MNDSDFSDFQHYLIVRLTQIALLASKLHGFLEQDAQTHNRHLEALINDPLFKERDLAEEAAKEGYRTMRELRELNKKAPDRVQEILRQSQLKLQHSTLNVELRLVQQVYPNVTLSSLTIMAFALFEQGLSSLCNAISDIRSTSLRLADLSGHSTIEMAQRYFTKVAGLGYDFATSKHWMRIKGHQDVRNLLTHNGGVLDDSSRSGRIKMFVLSDIPGLSISGRGIQIETRYVEELVNDVQEWLIEIYDLLDQKQEPR